MYVLGLIGGCENGSGTTVLGRTMGCPREQRRQICLRDVSRHWQWVSFVRQSHQKSIRRRVPVAPQCCRRWHGTETAPPLQTETMGEHGSHAIAEERWTRARTAATRHHPQARSSTRDTTAIVPGMVWYQHAHQSSMRVCISPHGNWQPFAAQEYFKILATSSYI